MPAPRARADEWLADAFGRHAQQWADQQGAAPAVADVVRKAAAALSRATSAGHVCANLRDIAATLGVAEPPISLDELRHSLHASRLVGSPAEPGVMPFILDGGDRLYLHRYFDYETRLARCVMQRCAASSGVRGGAELRADVAALLGALFPAGGAAPGAAVDWQKIAVVTALLGRLTIISGGPGTGKTTVIVNLLACLLEQNPACRAALAAPTGKAAARITETIRRRAAHLPERISAALPQQASTVHRLLGLSPDGGFVHHAGNPLPIDVLVLDEASMLDLALATQLFEAVPPAARIVLAGDKDQLAAVESGAVFAELSAGPRLSGPRVRQLEQLCGVAPGVLQESPGSAGGLAEGVIWLRHNYRFGSGSSIGRLADDINAGAAEAVLGRLRMADPSLTWLDDAAAAAPRLAFEALCAGYSRYIDACRTAVFDPAAVTRAFGSFRVLCAVREGHRGTTAVNQRLSAFLRRVLPQTLQPRGRSEWYPGRPVVVLRNDYALQLFNGDIGITLPQAGGSLMVYFPDAQSGFRAVAPVRLPAHETAFAMTVHKAQGSEFDDVLVLLPANPHPLLTREMLYTAVTRSRQRVTVVGSAAVVGSAVRSATRRLSGLSARLEDTAGACDR